MEALQIAGLSVCAAVIALTLRRMHQESSAVLLIAAGAMAALMVLPHLGGIISGITVLAGSGGVQDGYMTQLLKIGGVSLLMDFAAQTCRDAGAEGLALKTELAGRVMLIGLAMPVMQTLLEEILSLSR